MSIDPREAARRIVFEVDRAKARGRESFIPENAEIVARALLSVPSPSGCKEKTCHSTDPHCLWPDCSRTLSPSPSPDVRGDEGMNMGVDAAASPLLCDVLLALAERCENETPTLFLRIDIAKALGWREVEHDCHIRLVDPDGKMWRAAQSPDWTGSIDAAVSLVPPGAWRETNGPRRSINIPSPVQNFWRCEVTEWSLRRDFIGWAATEPMAICAAALKARAALAGKDASSPTSGVTNEG